MIVWWYEGAVCVYAYTHTEIVFRGCLPYFVNLTLHSMGVCCGGLVFTWML